MKTLAELMQNPNIMTPQDAAKKVGVNVRSIYRLVDQEKIKSWVLVNRILVDYQDILNYFRRAPVIRGRKPKNI